MKKLKWVLLKELFVLCYLLHIAASDLPVKLLEANLESPTTTLLTYSASTDVHLSPKRLLFHKPRLRSYSPEAAPSTVITPSQPPNYGPFVTSGHPPSSSRLSKPSMKKSALMPPTHSTGITLPGVADISPSQSNLSTSIPAGLAQPPLTPHTDCCGPDMVLKRGSQDCHCVYPIKIDLLLLNVSSNPNWNIFLQEFASKLGLRVSQIELINFYVISLSALNISMDVTPHTGISFSSSGASAINSSLSIHKIHLDPALVGEYKLLNLTWFKPPALSNAPFSASKTPERAPSLLPSTPRPIVTSNKGKHQNLILFVLVSAGVMIMVLASIITMCSCISHRQNHKGSTKETGASKNEIQEIKLHIVDAVPATGSIRHPASTRFLAYEELKEATNNFDSACILGEGGFGKVFKGVLSDGTAVAIKRLSCGGQQGDKEFLVEIDLLSRLHHRNLVKLVGYYSSRDSSQNLLCYELVSNGNLEAWLHGPLGMNSPLDWDTRMKIALDAARGLAYLHEDSQPCVIHRDFKASNILIENDFHAKVADFGLAKQGPEGRENYLSTRVMGTFGYVAPEYAMTGHLLVKSDVYSYGVVLLELLTGRKPVEMSQPSGQENLVAWARPIMRDKDRVEELADERLEGKYPKEDLMRACTIAAACVASEASQRPTMGEVVQSLKMVQRFTEYQESSIVTNSRPNNNNNNKQSSTTFESDGTSSVFSSGPYSVLSAFDNDNLSRPALFSEDLHEGR
ncbi:receptor-like serine/threonine-protein kinase ALE2 [Impatiens glandulifera]|uniref:receptor-like serine/threonine-protein kinase ALE2 n=1 Tax=Impatiens glandulifera TaxID=253017 RepID=UPI001FB12EF4|nr:receptor-like serine/threonine-protein kinase ALE2 [Impatiens glandulifera]